MTGFSARGILRTKLAVCCGLVFLWQVPVQTASGQAPAPNATGTSCISKETGRHIVLERDEIRVDATGKDERTADAGDFGRGVIAAEAPESERTMKEAYKWFQKAARKGDVRAQVNLAVLTLAGWGVRASAGEAIYWLTTAAEQGYAPALFDLGIMYMEGCGVRRDYAEAFGFFEKGALAGDSSAQVNLGYLYDQGLGVAQNRVQAAKWYRRAADSGEPRAQFNLGNLYLRGEGVERDEAAAFEWFRRAAFGGYPEARIMVGSMYAAGRGTQTDPAAAYMWFALAAQQGQAGANAKLESLQEQLTVPERLEAATRARLLAQASKSAMRQAMFH